MVQSRLNNQEYNKMLGNSKLITQVNEDPLIDEYNIEPFFKNHERFIYIRFNYKAIGKEY